MHSSNCLWYLHTIANAQFNCNCFCKLQSNNKWHFSNREKGVIGFRGTLDKPFNGYKLLNLNVSKRFNFSDSYNSQKKTWGLRSNPRKKLSLSYNAQSWKLVIVMMPSLNIRVTTFICHWLFKSLKLALRQSWGAFHGKKNRAAANVSSLADCSSIILCFFW